MNTEVIYPNDINGNDLFFIMDGLHFMAINTLIEYYSKLHEWDEWYVCHVSFNHYEGVCQVLVDKRPELI